MKKNNTNKSICRRSFICASFLVSNILLSSCCHYRIKDGMNYEPYNQNGGYNLNSASDKFPVVNIFIDYLCKYCNIIYPKIMEASGILENSITLKVRHFPNYELHKNSIYASRAVYAAGIYDKYIEMAQKLGENYEHLNNSELDIEEIHNHFYNLADELNLDRKKFVKNYNSDEAFISIKNDYNFGKNLGVHITPSFYTGIGKIHGIDSQSSVEEIVSHIRKSFGFTS